VSIFHGVLPIAALLMIGAGALLLRVALEEAEPDAPAAVRPEPARAPEPPAPVAPARSLRPTEGALWAGRPRDDGPRSGLWRP
jgi:hypothetical protein